MTVSSVGGTTGAWAMHQAQRPPRPDDDKLLATASEALGMDADDLKTALAGGRTLADVAKSKGVAKDDLVAAIAKDMQANAPEGAPALDDAKATEMAANLVEGKRDRRRLRLIRRAAGPRARALGSPPRLGRPRVSAGRRELRLDDEGAARAAVLCAQAVLPRRARRQLDAAVPAQRAEPSEGGDGDAVAAGIRVDALEHEQDRPPGLDRHPSRVVTGAPHDDADLHPAAGVAEAGRLPPGLRSRHSPDAEHA